MKTLLSILIPITPDRKEVVENLLNVINEYSTLYRMDVFNDGSNLVFTRYWSLLSHIEIILATDNREMTLGEKRERLYKVANGLYSIQVDSDDLISEDAIQLILNAIEQEPDVITFEESVTIDGKYSRSNFSLKYKEWNGDGSSVLEDGFHYQRSPFYKCVIKTEIARSVPFPKIRYNEDEQWSILLMPYLSSEVHIDKQLYIYEYTSTPFHERYGITNG